MSIITALKQNAYLLSLATTFLLWNMTEPFTSNSYPIPMNTENITDSLKRTRESISNTTNNTTAMSLSSASQSQSDETERKLLAENNSLKTQVVSSSHNIIELQNELVNQMKKHLIQQKAEIEYLQTENKKLRAENRAIHTEVRKLVERHKREQKIIITMDKKLKAQYERMNAENKRLSSDMETKMNDLNKKFQKQFESMKLHQHQHQPTMSTTTTMGSERGHERPQNNYTSFISYENGELSSSNHTNSIESDSLTAQTPTIKDVQNIRGTHDILLHNGWILDILVYTSSSTKKKMIASASKDKSINFTRLHDYRVIKTVEGHKEYVTSLAMTKIDESDAIASASLDESVKLWCTRTYKELYSFQCASGVNRVASYTDNHDGSHMLACGLHNGLIQIIDVQSRKMIHTLNAHASPIWAIHIFTFQDKLYMLSGDYAKKLNLWCLDYSIKLVKTLSDEGGIESVNTFEYNGDILIAGSSSGRIGLWRMSNLQLYHVFNVGKDATTSMKSFMLSNGKIVIATVSYNGEFRCLDVEEKKIVHNISFDSHRFYSLDRYDDDGNVVFIAGGKNEETEKGDLVFLEGY